jgi:hypothetical protein
MVLGYVPLALRIGRAEQPLFETPKAAAPPHLAAAFLAGQSNLIPACRNSATASRKRGGQISNELAAKFQGWNRAGVSKRGSAA